MWKLGHWPPAGLPQNEQDPYKRTLQIFDKPETFSNIQQLQEHIVLVPTSNFKKLISWNHFDALSFSFCYRLFQTGGVWCCIPLMRTKPMWQATAWSCVAWKLLDVVWSYDLIRPDTTCVSFVRVLHSIAMRCLLFNLNILPLARKHKSCSQNYGNTLPNCKQNLKATLGLKVAGNLQWPCWILASKSRVSVCPCDRQRMAWPPPTPVRSSCLLLPPSASRSHTTYSRTNHTQLSHTDNSLTHTTYSHTTYSHTQLTQLTHNSQLTHTHNSHTHTKLPHAQLVHTHNLFTHNSLTHTQLPLTQLPHTQLPHTHNLLTHNSFTHSLRRRGTWRHRHRPSLCVAGVAYCLLHLHRRHIACISVTVTITCALLIMCLLSPVAHFDPRLSPPTSRHDVSRPGTFPSSSCACSRRYVARGCFDAPAENSTMSSTCQHHTCLTAVQPVMSHCTVGFSMRVVDAWLAWPARYLCEARSGFPWTTVLLMRRAKTQPSPSAKNLLQTVRSHDGLRGLLGHIAHAAKTGGCHSPLLYSTHGVGTSVVAT